MQAQPNPEAVELHAVLNAIQSSARYGVYVCESFRDGRREPIDSYYGDVESEAQGIDDLHRSVGSVFRPLTDQCRADMHRFARALERLSKRIDRVVLSDSNPRTL